MTDLVTVSAVYHATKFKDYDYLIDLVKEGNPLVLNDPMAKEIIVKLMTGELKVIKRNPNQQPKNSQKKQETDKRLHSYLSYYIGAGFPAYNCNEKISACDKVLEFIQIYNEKCNDKSKRINFTSSDSLKPLIRGKTMNKLYYELGLKYANEKKPLEDIPFPFL